MSLEGVQSNQRNKEDGEESGCTRAPKGGGTSPQGVTQTGDGRVCDAGVASASGGDSAVSSEAGGKEDWLVQVG